MARATITAVAILGLAASLVSCAKGEGVQDNRTFAFADIEDFMPDDGRFVFSEPFSEVAGDSWMAGWPDSSAEVFEPAECITYMTSVEALLASDESATASDEVSFFGGEVASTTLGDGGYGAVYVKIRLFDSVTSASQFLSDFRTSVAPCTGGYTYTWDDWVWTAGSITDSDAKLPGIEGVLLIEEKNVNAGSSYDPESSGHFDHYNHYALARGNVVFIASYAFDGDSVTDDDAADLIGQFIEHLG